MAVQSFKVNLHTDKDNTENNVEIEVEKDLGDTIQEAVELYGEEAVLKRYLRQCVADIRNTARGLFKNNTNAEQTAQRLEEWAPNVSLARPKMDAKARVIKQFQGMDPEAKKAFLKALQEEVGV